MDANDDPSDGCEMRIRENKCRFGTCENHGVSLGETCSGWENLVCGENDCCACTNGYTDDGYCKTKDSGYIYTFVIWFIVQGN